MAYHGFDVQVCKIQVWNNTLKQGWNEEMMTLYCLQSVFDSK